jgi:hypothetical protein
LTWLGRLERCTGHAIVPSARAGAPSVPRRSTSEPRVRRCWKSGVRHARTRRARPRRPFTDRAERTAHAAQAGPIRPDAAGATSPRRRSMLARAAPRRAATRHAASSIPSSLLAATAPRPFRRARAWRPARSGAAESSGKRLPPLRAPSRSALTASPARVELATNALGKRCSIQLSYGDSDAAGASVAAICAYHRRDGLARGECDGGCGGATLWPRGLAGKRVIGAAMGAGCFG